MPYHFNVLVREGTRGLKLTREKYAVVNNKNSLVKFSRDIYEDELGKFYTQKWCEKQLEDCLKNYDLNMQFFSCLCHEEFNDELEMFLKRNRMFTKVLDLNDYDSKKGYYIMVLDEYCQVYIGTSDNIKKRIRQHWSSSKKFDRLLFPMGNIEGSILSIDSFRAFDTTRIFAYITNKTYEVEDKFINQFSPKFVTNRMAGGKVNGGLVQAMGMMKKRVL
jgi:hypothetical protein